MGIFPFVFLLICNGGGGGDDGCVSFPPSFHVSSGIDQGKKLEALYDSVINQTSDITCDHGPIRTGKED